MLNIFYIFIISHVSEVLSQFVGHELPRKRAGSKFLPTKREVDEIFQEDEEQADRYASGFADDEVAIQQLRDGSTFKTIEYVCSFTFFF